MRGTTLLAIALGFLTAPPLRAQAPLTARADLIDARGQKVGEAELRQTPGNGVLIRIDVSGLPPGVHGFHIHETGKCEPPSFESAGAHYAPRGRDHGFLVERGAHAGDLLNLHVPESGRARVEQLATTLTLQPDEVGTLFDSDGSAIVIHAGPDDYRTQPSGDSGDRLVCGVIRR